MLFFFQSYYYFLGKSYLLCAAANYATEDRYNVCISAPTGKLAARYARDLPDCCCNTAHLNYFIPIDHNNNANSAINWRLSDVYVLLVDKVIFKLFLQYFVVMY